MGSMISGIYGISNVVKSVKWVSEIKSISILFVVIKMIISWLWLSKHSLKGAHLVIFLVWITVRHWRSTIPFGGQYKFNTFYILLLLFDIRFSLIFRNPLDNSLDRSVRYIIRFVVDVMFFIGVISLIAKIANV